MMSTESLRRPAPIGLNGAKVANNPRRNPAAPRVTLLRADRAESILRDGRRLAARTGDPMAYVHHAEAHLSTLNP